MFFFLVCFEYIHLFFFLSFQSIHFKINKCSITTLFLCTYLGSRQYLHRLCIKSRLVPIFTDVCGSIHVTKFCSMLYRHTEQKNSGTVQSNNNERKKCIKFSNENYYYSIDISLFCHSPLPLHTLLTSFDLLQIASLRFCHFSIIHSGIERKKKKTL